MSRITIQDVNLQLGLNNTFDIVNAIVNENPATFKQYVPLASADNVAEVGQGILINQAVQNEFINALVDRISLVVVRKMSLQNPLKPFKKGMMPDGRTIEEIFTDIAKEQKYSMKNAESDVFKRTIPNVKVLFHERNRQSKYPQTISEEDLRSAFTSWSTFGNFVSSIINAIYNGAEVDEYKYMKLVIENYFSKGLFTVVPLATQPTDATGVTSFIKEARATATLMTLPMGTRDYNALAVQARSTMDDLYLIIPARTLATADVDVLAKSFNMDRTTFLGHVIPIDNFASQTVNGMNLEAVMIDKSWFMVYDNQITMRSIYNPSGLYWNYFYHVWQTLSASRFSNAVAFVSGTVPTVTNVIVSPTVLSLGQGENYTFDVIVRQNDNTTHTVQWVVEGSTSSTTVASGTAIDTNGKLTIGATQTGELKVTAKVDISVAQDGSEIVKGEAIVSISNE